MTCSSTPVTLPVAESHSDASCTSPDGTIAVVVTLDAGFKRYTIDTGGWSLIDLHTFPGGTPSYRSNSNMVTDGSKLYQVQPNFAGSGMILVASNLIGSTSPVVVRTYDAGNGEQWNPNDYTMCCSPDGRLFSGGADTSGSFRPIIRELYADGSASTVVFHSGSLRGYSEPYCVTPDGALWGIFYDLDHPFAGVRVFRYTSGGGFQIAADLGTGFGPESWSIFPCADDAVVLSTGPGVGTVIKMLPDMSYGAFTCAPVAAYFDWCCPALRLAIPDSSIADAFVFECESSRGGKWGINRTRF